MSNHTDTKLKPYTCSMLKGTDDKYYVSGPGCVFGMYAGTLFPESRFETAAAASAAANCANEAFRQGYIRAQRDMRESLGFKD